MASDEWRMFKGKLKNGVETMSIDISFEDFIVRKVAWSVLAAIIKKSKISGL